MIRALITNELRLVARDTAVRIVIVGYLFVLLAASLAFCLRVLTAGDSGLAVAELFTRLTTMQTALLACITPWLILHISQQDLGDRLVRFIAGIAAVPWQVLFAKILAMSICLAEFLSLSLPVLFVARLFGAASFRRIAWFYAGALLFLMILMLLTLHFSMRGGHWAVSWILSYSALAVLGLGWIEISSMIGRGSITIVFLLLNLVLGTLLFVRGNRSLVYLE